MNASFTDLNELVRVRGWENHNERLSFREAIIAFIVDVITCPDMLNISHEIDFGGVVLCRAPGAVYRVSGSADQQIPANRRRRIAGYWQSSLSPLDVETNLLLFARRPGEAVLSFVDKEGYTVLSIWRTMHGDFGVNTTGLGGVGHKVRS